MFACANHSSLNAFLFTVILQAWTKQFKTVNGCYQCADYKEVLVLAGIELIIFMVASMGLCFRIVC